MFYIKGRKTAKIKSYDDYYTQCTNCRTSNIRFTVFREYFHVFFVPLFPSDIKDVKGVCLNCGAQNGNRIKEDYLDKTRTPIYFYSGTILFVTAILFIIIFNINLNREESLMIDNPQIGDVYLIENTRANTREYYWAKVKEIKGDYLYVIKNSKYYNQIYSGMDQMDYFDHYKRTRLKKIELKQMYDDGQVVSVKRNYGVSQFNVEKNYE